MLSFQSVHIQKDMVFHSVVL